jgi:two-component system, NarL family, invasion response regulator UvrY
VAGLARETVAVLAVDDHEAFRIAARAVVAATPGFELVGEAVSGEDAVATSLRLAPDLVLLDVNMPDVDGLQTSRRLAGCERPPVVVLVSAEEDAASEEDVAGCGAAAFVDKRELSPRTLRTLWARHGRPR